MLSFLSFLQRMVFTHNQKALNWYLKGCVPSCNPLKIDTVSDADSSSSLILNYPCCSKTQRCFFLGKPLFSKTEQKPGLQTLPRCSNLPQVPTERASFIIARCCCCALLPSLSAGPRQEGVSYSTAFFSRSC